MGNIVKYKGHAFNHGKLSLLRTASHVISIRVEPVKAGTLGQGALRFEPLFVITVTSSKFCWMPILADAF